jgi:hypothetical protein
MLEVRFADFRLRQNGTSPCIGDVLEWRGFDQRVANVLAEQSTMRRFSVDVPGATPCRVVEPPKKQQSQESRRGISQATDVFTSFA